MINIKNMVKLLLITLVGAVSVYVGTMLYSVSAMTSSEGTDPMVPVGQLGTSSIVTQKMQLAKEDEQISRKDEHEVSVSREASTPTAIQIAKSPQECEQARKEVVPTVSVEEDPTTLSKVIVSKTEPKQFITELKLQNSYLINQREVNFYKGTWDSKLTLKENQENLVRMFLDECCDFSFKALDVPHKGIVLGTTSYGEFLILTDEVENIPLFSMITPCVHFNCNFLSEVNDRLKEQITGYFTLLSQDPIGCKLMRVVLAKYRANKDLYRITFIPQDDDTYDFNYVPSQFFGNIVNERAPMLKLNRFISATQYWKPIVNDVTGELTDKKIGPFPLPKNRWHFITCPSVTSECPVLISTASFDKTSGEICFSRRIRPVEYTIFHEIVHVLQSICKDRTGPKTTSVINARYRDELLVLSSTEKIYLSETVNIKTLWQKIYGDDVEFEAMFGIGCEGLNLLNEAAYLVSRYGFMRVSHTEFSIESVRNCFEKFIISYGDIDMYHYYLDPKSPIRLPRFGIGQYECSDLDPKTGFSKIREEK